MTHIMEPSNLPRYQVVPVAFLVEWSRLRVADRPAVDVYLDGAAAVESLIADRVGVAQESPFSPRDARDVLDEVRGELTASADGLAQHLRMNEDNVVGWLEAEQEDLTDEPRVLGTAFGPRRSLRFGDAEVRLIRFEMVANAARRAIAFEHMLAWRVLWEAGIVDFDGSSVAEELRRSEPD